MDWFSWLSRTGLDPLHTYEYGLLFAQNGLKSQHIPTFNHHFLLQIGIPIAKHRLEILKLAKFDSQKPTNHHKFLLAAFTRTKHCLRNCLRKLNLINSNPDPAEITPATPTHSEIKVKELLKLPPPPPRRRIRNVSHSGPLDGREHEKLMMNSKSLKLSGPLERKERPMFPRSPRLSGPLEGRVSDWALSKSPKLPMMKLIPPSRSPRVSGPLDGRDGSPRFCCNCHKERLETDDDYHSLWVSLFYDMKPT